MRTINITKVEIDGDTVNITAKIEGQEVYAKTWKSNLDSLPNDRERRKYIAGLVSAAKPERVENTNLIGEVSI